MAITHFQENLGTKTLHKMLQIYPKKVGISMNRVCPRVLTFLIVYLVKSVPYFHRPLPHCASIGKFVGTYFIFNSVMQCKWPAEISRGQLGQPFMDRLKWLEKTMHPLSGGQLASFWEHCVYLDCRHDTKI